MIYNWVTIPRRCSWSVTSIQSLFGSFSTLAYSFWVSGDNLSSFSLNSICRRMSLLVADWVGLAQLPVSQVELTGEGKVSNKMHQNPPEEAHIIFLDLEDWLDAPRVVIFFLFVVVLGFSLLSFGSLDNLRFLSANFVVMWSFRTVASSSTSATQMWNLKYQCTHLHHRPEEMPLRCLEDPSADRVCCQVYRSSVGHWSRGTFLLSVDKPCAS